MKLLLRSDVNGVGKRGDIVDVADGYARNFLVPKGFAITASSGAERQAGMMRRSRAIKDATDRASAEEIAKVLVPAVIVVKAKAGGEGRLFGSVTVADVVDAVYAQKSIELDRKDLHVDEPIKSVGQHYVNAKLHTDVQFQISVDVVPA
jgi:large subunit ribosomal protein L9